MILEPIALAYFVWCYIWCTVNYSLLSVEDAMGQGGLKPSSQWWRDVAKGIVEKSNAEVQTRRPSKDNIVSSIATTPF